MSERPVQAIAPPQDVTLPIVDLTEIPSSNREAQVLSLAAAEAKRPFDLTRDPLFRATLVRVSAEEHVLLLTAHHIVFDGWSTGVLYRELGILYESFLSGQESPLPELPIQYADFAVWQRAWLREGVLEDQLAYWKEQLQNVPPVIELPADHLRPPFQTYRGSRQPVVIPIQVTERLKSLSLEEEVTLFMTSMAAFQTLLFRYTGQDDFLVGVPIANRNHLETEALIGFFANTLVLRADLSGNPTFRELLHRVRARAKGAYSHQDLPFEKLVEELQPKRDPSRMPLFQVMFAFQNLPDGGTAPRNGNGQLARKPGLLSHQVDALLSGPSFDLAAGLNAQPFKVDTRHRQVRSDSLLVGNRARVGWSLAIQRRPVRSRYRRAHRPPFSDTAGRGGGQPGAASFGFPLARRGREAPVGGRVESDGSPLPAGHLFSSPVRVAGGTDTRCLGDRV